MTDADDDARYINHTAVTRPGSYVEALCRLPGTAKELVPVVQALLVHHSRVPHFAAGSGRPDDGTELRPLRAVLDAVTALDPAALTMEHPPTGRLVVDCRSSAVLLCGILREHGVPARVRFGFAAYLTPEHWQSHVICEHHGPDGRWTRTDPDLGRFDLGPDEFVDATQAWCSIPTEQDTPRYGYAPDLRGRWAVRWELVRDLAALTGFEPLTSDVWGMNATADGGSADGGFADLLNRVAAATKRTQRDQLAAHPALAVPQVITAAPYLTGRRYQVDLVADGSLDPGWRNHRPGVGRSLKSMPHGRPSGPDRLFDHQPFPVPCRGTGDRS